MRNLNQADREAGASSVEYAILASLIALAIVGALTAFGGAVAALYVVPF